MSAKVARRWAWVAAIALAGVLLLNYWASYQPLSTLAYVGIVTALCGLANTAVPFRFLAIDKRRVGAILFAGGLLFAIAALFWPAPAIRVVQHRTRLDDIMPVYQFGERHSTRVHARPEQVMEAVRQSTWADLSSLNTLLKIRGAVSGAPVQGDAGFARDKRILDVFSQSGSLLDSSDHEIVMFAVANMRTKIRPAVHTSQQFLAYHDEAAVKTAFDFYVEDAGDGWSNLSTETRMSVDEHSTRGPAVYWRLIVPGSGLLRHEWLDGIRRRAEKDAGAQG